MHHCTIMHYFTQIVTCSNDLYVVVIRIHYIIICLVHGTIVHIVLRYECAVVPPTRVEVYHINEITTSICYIYQFKN